MDWKDSLASLLNNSELLNTDSDSTPATYPAEDENKTKATGKRTLKIFFEKKGRAGKPATIIDGFPSDGSEDKICNELAGTLKKRLGRGGSARGGEILIQGDCRESLRKILRELGYEVKG